MSHLKTVLTFVKKPEIVTIEESSPDMSDDEQKDDKGFKYKGKKNFLLVINFILLMYRLLQCKFIMMTI